jgi:cation:H+ antiporter
VTIALWVAVFLVSLTVLVKASDLFVGAAEKVGLALGMSPFIIGVVVVGVGTSLPELVSSVVAVTSGTSEIVVGNVLGSNITNIFLILGLAGLLGGDSLVAYDLMNVDLPVFLIAAFLVALMVADGQFTRGEAVICLLGLSVYLLNALLGQPAPVDKSAHPSAGAKALILLLIGPIFIFLGAKFTVDAVIKLSAMLHIGADVIALSAVSLGTSLPEVLVTIMAARMGKPEMAIGNVMGSNIFNCFAVMGIPGLILPLHIPSSITHFSMPLSIAASLVCVLITMDQKVNRWEGGLLLVCYFFFLGKIFGII